MNIDEDIWIQDGVVVMRGNRPTVIKMPANTPRKLIALSSRRIEAERTLETVKKEVPPAEAELSECIATCEKQQKDIVASLQLMREEEERVRKGESSVAVATSKRNELAEKWRTYQTSVKHGDSWFGPVPQDPASVAIPESPTPIQPAFIEDHKKLEAEYLANVTKLAAADCAYGKVISNVVKAEENLRTAISEYVEQEKLYRQQKQAEEDSAQVVKAFEARFRELQIKAEKDRIEAGKKRLAELGVSEQ